jgi:hypothetical protein
MPLAELIAKSQPAAIWIVFAFLLWWVLDRNAKREDKLIDQNAQFSRGFQQLTSAIEKVTSRLESMTEDFRDLKDEVKDLRGKVGS